MKDENFEKMLRMVLSHEGGYVNNPNDKGGETNKGITHTTYDNYRKNKGLPLRSVKYITDEEVSDIYYNNYYKASGADKINDPKLATYVFDTSVNMGVSRAKDFLDESGGNLEKFESLRRAKYEEFAKANPKQAEFLQGWQNRVTSTKVFAENSFHDNELSGTKIPQVESQIPGKEIDNVKSKEQNGDNEAKLFKLYAEKYDIPNLNLPDFNNLMIDPYKESLIENPWDKIPMVDPWKSVPSETERLFTPQEIENMTTEEFTKNEAAIMEQLRNGQINTDSPKIDYQGYDKVFTREDIEKMSTDEYTKHEKEIMSQMNTIGIPNKSDLPKGTKTYEKEKSYSTSSKDQKWVTINGNHVLIEK